MRVRRVGFMVRRVVVALAVSFAMLSSAAVRAEVTDIALKGSSSPGAT